MASTKLYSFVQTIKEVRRIIFTILDFHIYYLSWKYYVISIFSSNCALRTYFQYKQCCSYLIISETIQMAFFSELGCFSKSFYFLSFQNIFFIHNLRFSKEYTRMLRAILNKSWRQHQTKHQLYGHLLPITKTIQVKRTWHAWYCKSRTTSSNIHTAAMWGYGM